MSIFSSNRPPQKGKLEGWEHSSPEDIARITREFDETTKHIIESDREPAYIRVASRRINSSKHYISSGQLRLPGYDFVRLTPLSLII